MSKRITTLRNLGGDGVKSGKNNCFDYGKVTKTDLRVSTIRGVFLNIW